MRSKGTAAELEDRRRLAVRRVGEGWTQRDVAAFLGVSDRAVGMWVAAHRRAGDAGLRAEPHPGRTPFLTPAQEKQILGWLADPPSKHGFPTDLWTAKRVADLIHKNLMVKFHPHYLREWLAKRDYTPQKPARPAKQRDQAEVGRWTRDDWPRIQKKSRPTRPTSC